MAIILAEYSAQAIARIGLCHEDSLDRANDPVGQILEFHVTFSIGKWRGIKDVPAETLVNTCHDRRSGRRCRHHRSLQQNHPFIYFLVCPIFNIVAGEDDGYTFIGSISKLKYIGPKTIFTIMSLLFY
jgi:hypothetical protein